MVATRTSLHVTTTQRGEVQAYLRKRNLPTSVAQRMRIVLQLDEGCSYSEISEQLNVPPPRSPVGTSVPPGRHSRAGYGAPDHAPTKLTPTLRAGVLARIRQGPPDGFHALVPAQDGGGHEGQ
jgi:hypothetical protein